MKYVFQVRSVPEREESIETKHARFLAGIADLPSPWGAIATPNVPAIGGALSIGVKAQKFLGKGPRGDVIYHYREDLVDSASSDDLVHLTFNPEKIDYRELIDTVFLTYVLALDAYYAERKKSGPDRRHSLYRIPAVSFMRDDFCLGAFQCSAEEIYRRLKGNAVLVELVHGGVFTVLTFDRLSNAQMDPLCQEAKRSIVG
jgi:hypothetical protein